MQAERMNASELGAEGVDAQRVGADLAALDGAQRATGRGWRQVVRHHISSAPASHASQKKRRRRVEAERRTPRSGGMPARPFGPPVSEHQLDEQHRRIALKPSVAIAR